MEVVLLLLLLSGNYVKMGVVLGDPNAANGNFLGAVARKSNTNALCILRYQDDN